MTDEELMRAALDEAKIAADLGEVPVGAVVAKDGENFASLIGEEILSPAPTTCGRAAKMPPTTPS